jgi:hypothetical protein
MSGTTSPSQPIDATLPSWTDAQAITSYLTSVSGVVLVFLGSLNPTWGSAPKWLAPSMALAGFVIATAAQIFNFISHRSATKAALSAHGVIHAAAISASGGDPVVAARLASVALQRPLAPPDPTGSVTSAPATS